MKKIALIALLVWIADVSAQSISLDEARAYADQWLVANPIATRYANPIELGDVTAVSLDYPLRPSTSSPLSPRVI